MVKAAASPVVQLIRRAIEDRQVRELPDRDLLQRFHHDQDEAAFHALLRRHGPMVWDVCRRVLSNDADAEDAFQATFLILARKAHSIRKFASLGCWLHGVAYRTSLKARAQFAARKKHEARTPAKLGSEPEDVSWSEVRQAVHEELSRLPERYRAPLVLCYLEGATQEAAAVQLDMAKSTLRERLEHGRALLRTRLMRRGFGPAALIIAAAWPSANAIACLPAQLVASTLNAASLIGAGQMENAVVSAKVAALTEGVLKAMLMSKLKAIVAVVLVLGFIVTGVALLTGRTAVAQSGPPLAASETKAMLKLEQPASPQAPQPKANTDLDKLQGTWEVATFQVRGIEVEGPIADQFKAIKFIFKGDRLIYDGKGEDGKPLPPQKIKLDPRKDPKHIDLIPLDAKLKATEGLYDMQGDELKLCLAQDEVRPKALTSNKDTREVYLILKRIAPKGKKDEEQAKEPFTTWGKPVGGLQAGLSFHPGQQRAYRHGETVKLVVRVRNVSKERVPFQYIHAFLVETPPTITDPDGKAITLRRYTAEGLQAPRDVDLAPGKEVELYELQLDLRAASERDSKTSRTLYGTGKFQIQYDQVIGQSSGGLSELDRNLYKLATGKLELEVTSDPPAQKQEDARLLLEGEWLVVALESDGEKASSDELKGMKWVFRGNEITGTNRDGSTGKMSFRFAPVAPGKKPKQIEITSLEGPAQGTTRAGIFELDGRRLRICTGEKGRPKEFATTPGSGLGMITLEKAAVGKEETGRKVSEIDGVWQLIRLIDAGKADDNPKLKHRVTVKEGTWEITRGDEGVIAKLTVSVDAKKNPKQLAFDAKGKKVLCIYELRGDELKIAMLNDMDQSTTNRPADFKETKETTVKVYQRVKDDREKGEASGNGGADKKELEKFQGKWVTVAVTADGKVQGEEEFKHRFKVVKGDKATFLFKDMERGTVSMKLDLSKSPAHFDATYMDGPVKGKTLKAIYKFEGDTLTICYGDIGGDRPAEFTSEPGSRRMLVVLKRAANEKED